MNLPLRNRQPFYYEEIFSVNVIEGFELVKIISNKKYLNKNGASFVFISSAARWITGTNLIVDGGYS